MALGALALLGMCLSITPNLAACVGRLASTALLLCWLASKEKHTPDIKEGGGVPESPPTYTHMGFKGQRRCSRISTSIAFVPDRHTAHQRNTDNNQNHLDETLQVSHCTSVPSTWGLRSRPPHSYGHDKKMARFSGPANFGSTVVSKRKCSEVSP